MTSVDTRQPLLLGIDLEDVRDQLPNGHMFQDRLKDNVSVLLDSLADNNVKGTFFTVGTLAQRHPDLIREIASRGHEIAAHGHNHTQLSKMTPKEFAEDLKRNIGALAEAQSNKVVGFRAPTFSLTPKTQWAYEILAEHGVTYSSSAGAQSAVWLAGFWTAREGCVEKKRCPRDSNDSSREALAAGPSRRRGIPTDCSFWAHLMVVKETGSSRTNYHLHSSLRYRYRPGAFHAS